MHREMVGVSESEAQLRQRIGPFVAAMGHGDKISDCEMTLAVCRVGRRGHGGCIGSPHRAGRPSTSDQRRISRLVCGQCLQPALIGAGQRQEEALRQSHRHIAAHLGNALQGSRARIGNRARILRRRQISEAETSVIVARANHTVKIDFGQAHRKMLHT